MTDDITDVFHFYSEIAQERPELFSGMHGDPYQSLKTVLRGMISE
jgi:hypothetical protein